MNHLSARESLSNERKMPLYLPFDHEHSNNALKLHPLLSIENCEINKLINFFLKLISLHLHRRDFSCCGHVRRSRHLRRRRFSLDLKLRRVNVLLAGRASINEFEPHSDLIIACCWIPFLCARPVSHDLFFLLFSYISADKHHPTSPMRQFNNWKLCRKRKKNSSRFTLRDFWRFFHLRSLLNVETRVLMISIKASFLDSFWERLGNLKIAIYCGDPVN